MRADALDALLEAVAAARALLVSSGNAVEATTADVANRRATATHLIALERADELAEEVEAAAAERDRLCELVLAVEPWIDLAAQCTGRTAQATVSVARRLRMEQLRRRLDEIRRTVVALREDDPDDAAAEAVMRRLEARLGQELRVPTIEWPGLAKHPLDPPRLREI